MDCECADAACSRQAAKLTERGGSSGVAESECLHATTTRASTFRPRPLLIASPLAACKGGRLPPPIEHVESPPLLLLLLQCPPGLQLYTSGLYTFIDTITLASSAGRSVAPS